MKKIKYLSLMLAIVFSASSCKGFLDQESETAVSTEEAITSYDDAIAAVYGVYDALQGNSGSTSYYAAQFIAYGDVRGDLMQNSNLSGSRTASLYEMQYHKDNAPATAWNLAYRTIRRANNVLLAIEQGKAVGATEEQANQLRGECLALRALAHFDLVRVYSLPYTKPGSLETYGVPVETVPTTPSHTPGRGTVAEVYTQVLKDLNDALPMLSGNKKLGAVNRWVVLGLMSRVYLFMGDYTNALASAEAVINGANMPYSLWKTTDYPTQWNVPGSSEFIFEIVNNSTQDFGDLEGIGNLMQESGYGSISATPSLVKYFSNNPDDVRGKLLLASTTEKNIEIFGDAHIWCNKYPGRDGVRMLNNIPAMRLAEIYLTAAEAAVRLGGSENQTKANTYLNKIYQRANPAAAELIATVDNVFEQRGIELFGEGHRAFDMMRAGKTVDRTSANRFNYGEGSLTGIETFNWDSHKAFLPIPITEVNANPTIRDQKNAGY